MDKKLKTKWANALRSGRYRQISGDLNVENGYCCLGVLCKVARKPIAYETVEELLQKNVSKDVFIGMNDRRGFSFVKIADFIDKQKTL